MRKIQFVGTCVSLSGRSIDEFDDSAREITYKTFLKHLGWENVKQLNEDFGVPLSEDWAVSFEKGKWKGKKAVCLHHSSIHHIWTIE
jgi:hypothetical protein